MNSCGGDNDPIEPDTPTVSEIVLADKNQSALEFDAGASSQTVRFSTTQTWSAEVSSGDWCTVSPASGSAGNGSITVSVSENTEEAERSATVTLKAGEASQTLRVAQEGAEVVPEPDPEEPSDVSGDNESLDEEQGMWDE